MNYGLRTSDIEKINSVFAKYPQVEKVILYGSRAKGNYRNGSDIDLTLTGDNLDSDILLKIETELDDLLLPYKIDLSIKEKIGNPDLLEHIERVGKVFYEKEQLLDSDNDLSEWKEYRLGELGAVVTGKTPSKNHPEDWGNLMPFITPSDYKNYKKKANCSERKLSKHGIEKLRNKVLPKNSILVTCIGSDMGKVVMNNVEAITNQQINSIIPNAQIVSSNFLYYRLVAMYEMLRIYGGDGTAVPIINKGDFENLVTGIPPLPEQRAIASVLSSLDDKIDLLHRQNKTLEAMAETLFRQWFVEEAKEDWEAGVLDDILTVKGGTTPSTKNPEFWNGKIHWTTPRDLSNNSGIFLFDTIRKITFKGLNQISSGLLPIGTLLLSSRAPVGYLAFSEVPIAINQGYIAIIDDKGISKYWIYLWLKENMDYVKSHANGSTFQEISKTSFKKLQVVIPSKEVLERFDKIIKVNFDKIRTNTKQIRTLEKLRDTLLPKLMSGEVRVKY